jgi:hypothetical protein
MKKTNHTNLYRIFTMEKLKNRYKSFDRQQAEMEPSLKRSKEPAPLVESHIVDFLIIGSQKAGTTALATNLNKHPDIFVKNECQFFTFCWDYGVEWYHQQLRSNKPYIGEKTPEIIYCDDCAPRVKQVCPKAKFILCLRDPIRRFLLLSVFSAEYFSHS